MLHLNIAPEKAVGQFAVFRKSKDSKNIKFKALHETYGEASEEAVRLCALACSEKADHQHTFFVVELLSFFSAGPEGLTSKETR